MARRVVWTTAALDELREMADYVAQSDAPESRRVVEPALAEADDSANFPTSGAIIPELDSASIREVIVKRPFRLIYEVSADRITILVFIRAKKRLDRKILRSRRSSG